jgi:hypothetical protein
MGEAQRRLEQAGDILPFDADKIGFRIGPKDRANLEANPDGKGKDPSKVTIRMLAFVARAIIALAFKQGMDRRDGKMWAAWLDLFDEEAVSFRATRGQVEWLAKHTVAVEVAPELAGWREALACYLEELAKAPAIAEPNGPSTAPAPPPPPDVPAPAAN